jgi:hypothetical protein
MPTTNSNAAAKEQTSQKTVVSTLVLKINEARNGFKCTSLVENPESKNIGNNGYSIGSTYTFTGDIELAVPVRIDGVVTSTFIGLKTEQGAILNLAQIMGISSLKGYSIDSNQEFVQESDNDDDQVFSPDVIEGYTANELEKVLFQPQSRNLYEEACILIDNPEIIKGKKVTFLGTAYRPFVAKKANSVMGYSEGAQRVIAQRLWGFEFKPKRN